jgi:hypothetical protein
MKTGRNLAESSKEGYGSKKAVLPMMMMMMDKPIYDLMYTRLKIGTVQQCLGV